MKSATGKSLGQLAVLGVAATAAWCLTAWLYAHATGQTDEPPRLQIDRTTWDFGSVPAGPVMKARFPLRNEGGTRLVLREQSASCECLSATRPSIKVAPGQRHALVVEMKTADLRGPLQLELVYSTNDPRRPRLQVLLRAQVESHGTKGRTASVLSTPTNIPAAP